MSSLSDEKSSEKKSAELPAGEILPDSPAITPADYAVPRYVIRKWIRTLLAWTIACAVIVLLCYLAVVPHKISSAAFWRAVGFGNMRGEHGMPLENGKWRVISPRGETE